MIADAWHRGEVAVIGLGRSGTAAARWLRGQGIAVYASDTAATPALEDAARQLRHLGIAVDIGRHDIERVRRAAAVIVSPGVPPNVPAIRAARDAGVEVLAELDLALDALTDVRTIVITGTNGKTTTTALTAHVLRSAGLEAISAGNIGRPLISVTDDDPPPSWVVVEASSYQLHDAPHLRPTIGVLTNLGSDHLDRYPSLEAYHADKALLFRNATDASVWVLNGDDTGVVRMGEGVPGRSVRFSLTGCADAWLNTEHSTLMLGDDELLARRDLELLGDHNVANALAAALAAVEAGVSPPAIAGGLRSFRPLPHRLESVGRRGGLHWINDSKSTNVASAVVGVQAMDGPFVLILGGRDKGQPYTPLRPLLQNCRGVIAYGEAASLIARDLEGAVPIDVVSPFDDAVSAAVARALPGDALLLSPACASFDQFEHFEARGDRFRTLAADE